MGREKQIARLYEEKKYAKESARNYDDHVRSILAILAFILPQLPP